MRKSLDEAALAEQQQQQTPLVDEATAARLRKAAESALNNTHALIVYTTNGAVVGRYVGQVLNGSKHGSGVYIDEKNECLDGVWVKDQLWNEYHPKQGVVRCSHDFFSCARNDSYLDGLQSVWLTCGASIRSLYRHLYENVFTFLAVRVL